MHSNKLFIIMDQISYTAITIRWDQALQHAYLAHAFSNYKQAKFYNRIAYIDI